MSKPAGAEQGGETNVIPLHEVAEEKLPWYERFRRFDRKIPFLGKVMIVGVTGVSLILFAKAEAMDVVHDPAARLASIDGKLGQLNTNATDLLKKADQIQQPVEDGANDLDELRATGEDLRAVAREFADQFGFQLPSQRAHRTTTTTVPVTPPAPPLQSGG